MKFQGIFLVLASLCALANATSTFSPVRPPALPLAVKSPYLSTWQIADPDGRNGGYLAGRWATHWAGKTTSWTGLILVDDKLFTWMGAPNGSQPFVTQTAFEYTSTRSIFAMDVGGMLKMTVTFLSPVTAEDMKRQSLVMSYMNVAVESADGEAHHVRLYSDISAEWVSGDNEATAEWDYGTVNGIAYHKVWKQTQLLFSETNDMADWGTWYYATDDTRGLTYQSGSFDTVRNGFASSGILGNSTDAKYRAINDDSPVFGLAVDLGLVAQRVDTLFSLGLCQEEAVLFSGNSGTNGVPSLWASYFSSDLAALSFFHQDFAAATGTSATIDGQIASDTVRAGGNDYTTVTSLAFRQAFAGTQLCGTQDKMYLFIKEISSNGNSQTVDVIFPIHPVFIYANPTLLKLSLDPLFEHQEAGLYPNKYAMHDLGIHFPNLTGYPAGSDEEMPLEECGNMLILTLLYAQKAKDPRYLTQHYKILRQWTGYLLTDALYPAGQLSTDDFLGPLTNMTNLALKGIIGIGAMAEIANITGNVADAEKYNNIAHSYIAQWQTLALNQAANPPFLSLTYGDNARYGMMYNLYGDKALGLNLVPQHIYDVQSNFLPTVRNRYGVPLDPRHSWTKGDWEMFSASVASPKTAALLISDLAGWIDQTRTNIPYTDLYDASTGNYPPGRPFMFKARPVMGGTFASLVVNGAGGGAFANPAAPTNEGASMAIQAPGIMPLKETWQHGKRRRSYIPGLVV